MFGTSLAHLGKENTRDISEPLRWCCTVSSSLKVFCSLHSLIDSFGTKRHCFQHWLCTGRTGIGNLLIYFSFLGVWQWLCFESILIMTSVQKRTTRHLSYTPSQEGSGWLQKWFFSQTSGSSWLSLYPGSHWNDTVDPMDRSVFDRAPLTGIPGSMQEYVSNVTTAEMEKYRECLLLFCTIIGMKIC